MSHIISPRDLFRLLAIGMCHFLPMYYLGIAFLGRVEGSKYNSITLILTFHCFFSSLIWSKYLSVISLSFIFTMLFVGKTKSTKRQILSLSLSLSLMFRSEFGDHTASQNPREFCGFDLRELILVCAYPI